MLSVAERRKLRIGATFMSRGLGKVQRSCLDVIHRYESEGDRLPTTYNITAEVYAIAPDKNNNRWITNAQHVAVKRALHNLQQKGRIIGFRDVVHTPYAPSEPGWGKMELCHYWMTEPRLTRFLTEQDFSDREFLDSIVQLATAIGMKVPPGLTAINDEHQKLPTISLSLPG
jgi:hypothetical protein